jgi:hypothetical protein
MSSEPRGGRITSTLDAMAHYKKKILRHMADADSNVLLHCLEKLSCLTITSKDLQKSGLSRVLITLRGSAEYCTKLGKSLKKLIENWKKFGIENIGDLSESTELKNGTSKSKSVFKNSFENTRFTKTKSIECQGVKINENKLLARKSFKEEAIPSIVHQSNIVSTISVITSTNNENLQNCDLQNVKGKRKRPRYSSECKRFKAVSKELETDLAILERRQKQILYGKNDPAYKNYISNVPKDKRNEKMPMTPDKNLVYSRREFDGLVKHWKRQVHNWDNNRNNVLKRLSTSGKENSLNED